MRVVKTGEGYGACLNREFAGAEDLTVRLLAGYAVLGLLGVGLFPLVSGRAVPYNIWYVAWGVLASLIVLVGAARRPRAARGAWLVLGIGLSLFAGGDLVYLVYAVAGAEMPWPSVADYLYLAGYPVLAVGLGLLIRSRSPGRDLPTQIDAAIITAAVSGASWVFLMGPIVGDRSMSVFERIVSLAQPMGDVALIALCTRLFISSSRGSRALQFLVAAVFLQFLGDIGYGVGVLQGWYDGDGPLDLLWVVSYLLWGATMLHPSAAEIGIEREVHEEGLSGHRLALLAVAVLVAPAMLLYGAVRTTGTGLVVSAGTAVVAFFLIVLRLGLLTRRHSRARRREQLLQAAAARYVAAGSRDEVVAVTWETAQRLADDLRGARTAVGPLADDLPRDPIVLGETEAAVRLRLERGEVCTSARFGEARAIVAPLVDHEDPALALVVSAGVSIQPWVLRAFETLVSQAVLAFDVVDRAESQVAQRSQARFAALVQRSKDVIAILEEDGTIRFVTPSVRDVLGLDPDALVGSRLQRLLPPDALMAFPSLADAAGSANGRLEREWRLKHVDGAPRSFDAVLTDMRDDPSVEGFVVTAHDITERKALEEQLSYQAFHDALTGLPNRALFSNRVEHALARRGPGRVAVLFVDVDDFKTVNDSLGHDAGDALLVQVARRVRECLRPEDTPARLGGDEFAILLEGIDGPGMASDVAQRLLDSLRVPVDIGVAATHARASIGIAIGSPEATVGDLLRNADLAMYRAKSAGGFRFALFEQEMHDAATMRLQLKADLTRALEEDRLDVVFQPIVRLDSGDTVGAEALVRWTHAELGPIPPAVFIPLAEETGLIVDLGRWVLEHAIATAAAWAPLPTGEHPFMSVNISARQLQDAGFVAFVEAKLAGAGLDSSRLVLEITESTLMSDQADAVERLAELRSLGAQVWIDDFGTGFSSLSYLQDMPVDALKIPKQFVDGLGSAGSSGRLAAAVVQVAESLHLDTVAEGIEQPEQQAALIARGCQYGQGYHFGQPMPAAELRSFGITLAATDALAA